MKNIVVIADDAVAVFADGKGKLVRAQLKPKGKLVQGFGRKGIQGKNFGQRVVLFLVIIAAVWAVLRRAAAFVQQAGAILGRDRNGF